MESMDDFKIAPIELLDPLGDRIEEELDSLTPDLIETMYRYAKESLVQTEEVLAKINSGLDTTSSEEDVTRIYDELKEIIERIEKRQGGNIDV